MTKQFDELPEKPDRFNSVESVATQIFDRMPCLDPEDAAHIADHDDATDIGNAVAAKLSSLTGSDQTDEQSIFVRSEKLLSSLLLALNERDQALRNASRSQFNANDDAARRNVDFAKAPDISFHAANRRAQLPEGIEILQGKPEPRPVEETLSSIKEMIQHQEREQAEIKLAKKREFNKQVLPVLEAQEVFEEPLVAAATQKPSFPQRCFARLQRRFRGEYFLIFSLSGWSTLALMVFIEPGLASVLCFFSLFLLFVSYCLFSDKHI